MNLISGRAHQKRDVSCSLPPAILWQTHFTRIPHEDLNNELTVPTEHNSIEVSSILAALSSRTKLLTIDTISLIKIFTLPDALLYHMTLCYICNTRTGSLTCSECKKPVCKKCTRDFPFSESACLECAVSIKTGLGGTRKDEEIF